MQNSKDAKDVIAKDKGAKCLAGWKRSGESKYAPPQYNTTWWNSHPTPHDLSVSLCV